MREILQSTRYPFVQAPMAGAQDEQLAVAVCQAGGIGSLPAAMLNAEQLANQLQQLTMQVQGAPFNVNFFAHQPPQYCPQQAQQWLAVLQPIFAELGIDANHIPNSVERSPFDEAALQVIEYYRPAIVSFHFGLPEKRLLDAVRACGCKIIASATTLNEARYLEAQKIDGIIAQGWEAGGHRGWFLDKTLQSQSGTFALLPQLVQACQLPIIAAGGIVHHQTVQAALILGAAAVQCGTAFLLANEAKISAEHRVALMSSSAQNTAVTNIFSGGGARGIVTPLMQRLGIFNEYVPDFPLAGKYAAIIKQAAAEQDLMGYSSLWAGQNAPLAQTGSAAEIVARLVASCD